MDCIEENYTRTRFMQQASAVIRTKKVERVTAEKSKSIIVTSESK